MITIGNIFLLIIMICFLCLSGQKDILSIVAVFSFSALLDAMDGTAARYQKIVLGINYQNGETLDAVSGYVFNIAFWLMVMMTISQQFGVGSSLYLVYLTGILSILPRLMAKKMEESSVKQSSGNNTLSQKVDQELSFTGFLIPLFLISWIFEKVWYFIIFYAVFYLIQFAYVLVKIYRSHGVITAK